MCNVDATLTMDFCCSFGVVVSSFADLVVVCRPEHEQLLLPYESTFEDFDRMGMLTFDRCLCHNLASIRVVVSSSCFLVWCPNATRQGLFWPQLIAFSRLFLVAFQAVVFVSSMCCLQLCSTATCACSWLRFRSRRCSPSSTTTSSCDRYAIVFAHNLCS